MLFQLASLDRSAATRRNGLIRRRWEELEQH